MGHTRKKAGSSPGVDFHFPGHEKDSEVLPHEVRVSIIEHPRMSEQEFPRNNPARRESDPRSGGRCEGGSAVIGTSTPKEGTQSQVKERLGPCIACEFYLCA